jgi:hypothetical protein
VHRESRRNGASRVVGRIARAPPPHGDAAERARALRPFGRRPPCIKNSRSFEPTSRESEGSYPARSVEVDAELPHEYKSH